MHYEEGVPNNRILRILLPSRLGSATRLAEAQVSPPESLDHISSHGHLSANRGATQLIAKNIASKEDAVGRNRALLVATELSKVEILGNSDSRGVMRHQTTAAVMVALACTLAISPFFRTAQQKKPQHARYTVIDLGTFGGPTSTLRAARACSRTAGSLLVVRIPHLLLLIGQFSSGERDLRSVQRPKCPVFSSQFFDLQKGRKDFRMAQANPTPAPVYPINGSDTETAQAITSELSHLNADQFASAHVHFGGSSGTSDSGLSPTASVSNLQRTSVVTNRGSSVFGGVLDLGETIPVNDPTGPLLVLLQQLADAGNAINAKAAQLGGVGIPFADVDVAGTGFVRRFTNADIYFSPATGAHEVNGAIPG